MTQIARIAALAGSVTIAVGACFGQPMDPHLPVPPMNDCGLVHMELPPGVAGPRFDPATWSAFESRTGPSFTVTINDPTGTLAPFASGITSNLLAAANRWGQFLDANGSVTLQIVVLLDNNLPRAGGRSATTCFVGTRNGFNVFEQGAACELRTGSDPNGAAPDIEIFLSIDYVANELWFDPQPQTRTVPVPSNRTDAVSVFLHELGHAFAFNGWRDWTTGQLPSNFRSPYDELSAPGGPDFFFLGATAQARYGGPVPQTRTNITHYGNWAPAPGSDLIPDLMNGVVFFRGQRYDMTTMVRGVSFDVGVRITPPSPGPTCDSLDFNNDGIEQDPTDIEAFLSVYSGGPCIPNASACNDIDFNNDGIEQDPTDIESFLSVYSGGGCL